jgi:RHS repeat-associated protein
MYDANGNLTNDGAGKTFAYDAANRMISVTQGSNVTGYVYDGLGRRVQETLNGTVIKQWVWCKGAARPCEERDGSNNVTKRFYGRGEQIGGVNYFYTKDHEGSIREMTNSAGGLVARYDYDPYGRRTLVSGTDLADFGFTGFYYDQATSLDLTYTRAYDANLGRWLSRDPAAEEGGINLYRFVSNDPLNRIDPLGLWQFTIGGGWGWGGIITFGNNGGHWNFGAYAGAGAGAYWDYDDADSGCHEKGFHPGWKAKGEAGYGDEEANINADIDGDGDITEGTDTFSFSHSEPSTGMDETVGVTIDQSGKVETEGPSVQPTSGWGAGAAAGIGGTYYW